MSTDQNTAGFALISAIFILVVMAVVGAYMVNIGGVERETTNLALLEYKAFYAAHSGLEWGLHQAVDNPAACPADTFSLTEGGISGFDVTVTCSESDHTEGTTTTTVFRITSKAERGSYGGRDYVSRRLEATAMVSP